MGGREGKWEKKQRREKNCKSEDREQSCNRFFDLMQFVNTATTCDCVAEGSGPADSFVGSQNMGNSAGVFFSLCSSFSYHSISEPSCTVLIAVNDLTYSTGFISTSAFNSNSAAWTVSFKF